MSEVLEIMWCWRKFKQTEKVLGLIKREKKKKRTFPNSTGTGHGGIRCDYIKRYDVEEEEGQENKLHKSNNK